MEFQSDTEDARKWDLWHTLINTVKFAKGMPLSVEKNPYRRGRCGKSDDDNSGIGGNGVID